MDSAGREEICSCAQVLGDRRSPDRLHRRPICICQSNSSASVAFGLSSAKALGRFVESYVIYYRHDGGLLIAIRPDSRKTFELTAVSNSRPTL